MVWKFCGESEKILIAENIAHELNVSPLAVYNTLQDLNPASIKIDVSISSEDLENLKQGLSLFID